MLLDRTTIPPHRTSLGVRARALRALARLACDHAAPFTPGGYAPGIPFGNAIPRRLTWNRLQDRTPAWSDDGQLLFYAYEAPADPGHDRCLASLPPRGGSRLLDICPDTPGPADSVDAWESPAATRSRVACLKSSSGIAQVAASRPVPGRTVFFTVMGDTRVFALDLVTGLATVVHDFGTGIPREVQVKGNRLVAVIGGRVTFTVDPALGPLQRDDGGPLIAVDLTSGAETVLALPSHGFRRPALAPGGRRLAVEGSPTVAPRFLADLWLLEEP